MSLHKHVDQWSGSVGVGVVVYGALAVATACVCWLGGERTWSDFGTGLIVLGGIALLIGAVAGKGVVDARAASAQRAPGYRAASRQSSIDGRDLTRAWRLLLSVALAGALTLASGLLIHTF